MQTNKILSAPLIDLIFDGRNKEYGAYELRSTYERRIKKSLLITFSILAVSIGGAAIAGSMKKVERQYVISDGHTIASIPEEKIEPIVEPEKKIEEVQVKTQKFTEMVIVEDDKVTEDPPTIDDFKDAQIDIATKDGDPFIGIVASPGDLDEGKDIVEVKPVVSDDPVSFVEIEAKFNGNWRAFLERNLNAEVPLNNNAPAGRYSVVIQFVVDKNGNVSDITALTSHGYGMEEEAIRVLRKAAKWEPAIQNGNQVKAYRRQPITFDVQSEE